VDEAASLPGAEEETEGNVSNTAPMGPGGTTAASGLTQVQQVTDPDNQPSPQDDDLPEGVMFPVGDSFAQQWTTGPGGAQPTSKKEGARSAMSPGTAEMFGRMDAIDRRQPQHQDNWAYSSIQHGRYLRGWNDVSGMVHAMAGNPAMSRDEYGKATGRPDLHPHYLAAYADGRKAHSAQPQPQEASQGVAMTGAVHQADAWTAPHQTTDDQAPPYNTPATAPQPVSTNTDPHAADFSAGLAAGKADKAAGQRPAFADNSSGVSPYVKGYATGYGAPGRPPGQMDVPSSLEPGADSGQAMNVQQAQQAFQVARASLSFAPAALFEDGDFAKGYLFASKWQPGTRLVDRGVAAFEAGLYAGITDAGPDRQQAWLSAHAAASGSHPQLGQRIALQRSFTRKHARKTGLQVQGAYIRAAGTTTDLITDGPGTSPDPMGATPLNGPGTPPPMAGLDNANAPGGASPYQGAPPLGGGPVAPDDVVGNPQQAPQPSGPFTNTFSGDHPENTTLAPVAPNSAAEPGYSNKNAYSGSPLGGDRTANLKLAAFRQRVQDGLVRMGATA
jgi:hypothetical protein